MYNLVKKWQQARNNMYPDDESHLGSDLVVRFETAEEYIQSDYFADPKDEKFHVGLQPMPYIGNLSKASIFILTKNPGLTLGDYYIETQPFFQEYFKKNIFQENLPYPFFFLDSVLGQHNGYEYWIESTRELVESLFRDSSYSFRSRIDVLKFLANQITIIELVPYHSYKFENLSTEQLKKVITLPSVIAIKSFVHDELLHRVKEGHALLVVWRGKKFWEISEHPPLKNLIFHPTPVSKYLTPVKRQILDFLFNKRVYTKKVR